MQELRLQRDVLVDELDVCRATRDRYRKASGTLRADLTAAETLMHSVQAAHGVIAHRIQLLDSLTHQMLDEETITVGEIRYWLRTGEPSPATARREQQAAETTPAVSGTIAIGETPLVIRLLDGEPVRLTTGTGRTVEGYRAATCPGDGMAGHRHDVRCVAATPHGTAPESTR
ncbi:hypothetical protein [Micromonospora sp. Llam0]|uniref:hypothetical protein n=1 Tax=Micromonospora sp. Llam0 TaxID=2485143 RepID=UPI000F4A3F74|nr:hypothetical protein [Micromonospora sp. Llam0]